MRYERIKLFIIGVVISIQFSTCRKGMVLARNLEMDSQISTVLLCFHPKTQILPDLGFFLTIQKSFYLPANYSYTEHVIISVQSKYC